MNIKIDKDMILEEMYNLRALIDLDNQVLKTKVDDIIKLLSLAPTDNNKSNYPSTRLRKF